MHTPRNFNGPNLFVKVLLFVKLDSLGSVDKLDPDTDAAEQDKAQEAAVGFIVARGDPPVLLEMADQALDARTQPVERLVDRILDLSVSPGWYGRNCAAIARVLANGVAVVSLVGQQDVWVAVALGHQLVIGGDVVGLAGGQDDRDRQTIGIGADVGFG